MTIEAIKYGDIITRPTLDFMFDGIKNESQSICLYFSH